MENWRDKYGIMHLRPDPDVKQTENGPLYTGTNFILEALTGHNYDYKNILIPVHHLHNRNAWKTTPDSDLDHFSLDNFTGVVCALQMIKKQYPNTVKQALDSISLFRKELMHPKDFVTVGYAKYPFLFWWFLWIPSICMIVSAWQSHKVRGEAVIPKTDGKILAFLRCHAFKMRITWFIVDRLIRNKWRPNPHPWEKSESDGSKWKWGSWYNVFLDYYKRDDHPNVLLVKQWEENR